MVGNKSDVLKHTVCLFLPRQYEYPILYKLLRLYNDSSFNVWILLKTVFFILILTTIDLCNAVFCTSCSVLVEGIVSFTFRHCSLVCVRCQAQLPSCLENLRMCCVRLFFNTHYKIIILLLCFVDLNDKEEAGRRERKIYFFLISLIL